jgi:hypothetical protein
MPAPGGAFMKKFSGFLAILALVLVFGLAFVGCDNSPTDIPDLKEIFTAVRTGTPGNYSYTPATTFSANQVIAIRIRYSSPYQDMARAQVFIKRGGDIWYASSANNWAMDKTEETFIASWWYEDLPAGSYTAEAYIVDIDGKKSNTLSTNFTVTP